jgi:hypothetical protein
MSERFLRPGDCVWALPERPAPKSETTERLTVEWIAFYDNLSANESQVLYKHDPAFARKVDLLLAQRSTHGY